MKPWAFARKGWNILRYRLREQGLWVTLQWVWGRGIPKITGVPLLRYSRVTPQIYVGPQFNKLGKRALERAGITADVNLRVEFDDAAHGLALEHYCHLPTVDDAAPAVAHLQEGVDFIDAIVRQGGKVYIHCKAGVGRAPTMAAAYFLSQGMALDEAIALIKQARPFITITPPQMAGLRAYELQARKDIGKAN